MGDGFMYLSHLFSSRNTCTFFLWASKASFPVSPYATCVLLHATPLPQAWGSEWTMTRDLGTLRLVMQPSNSIFSSELMVESVGIRYC